MICLLMENIKMNLSNIIKGKVLIIAVDTLPLELTTDAPEKFIYEDIEYNIKDKCTRATALGTRTWQIANEIRKIISIDTYRKSFVTKSEYIILEEEIKESITILIPDINYPGSQYIENKEFTFKSYNYKKAIYNYSKELEEEIKLHDTIIIQMIGGIGFLNFPLIPKDKILIYDGFENQLLSLPYALMNYDEDYKREYTKNYKFYYEKILERSDYILYCNEPMKYYYESQLYFINKLGYNQFQQSPLIKFPYILENNDLGIDREINYDDAIKNPNDYIITKVGDTDVVNLKKIKLNLVWYGAAYNWYDIPKLLDIARNNKNIELDFVAVRHPRYKNSWDEKLFENLPPNVKVIEEYQDLRWNIYKNYDAGILLTRDDIIDNYITSCRLYDMLSYGLPVITNANNPIFNEIEMEKDRYNLKKVIVEDIVFNDTECKMKKLSIVW